MSSNPSTTDDKPKPPLAGATGSVSHGLRVIPAFDELPANRKCKNLPATWGAYHLHPDGWYRLFPPNGERSHGAVNH